MQAKAQKASNKKASVRNAGAAGERPARRAAPAMRERTASRLPAMSVAATTYLRKDFSASKFVCASLAFGPFGAIFKYVSNSVTASGSLPRLM